MRLPPDFWAGRWEFLRKQSRLTFNDHLILGFFVPPVNELSNEISQKLRGIGNADLVTLAKSAQSLASDPASLQRFASLGPTSPDADTVALALLLTAFRIWRREIEQSVIQLHRATWISIADHIGLWSLRYILEDTIFEILQPEEFMLMQSVLKKNDRQYKNILNEAIAIVRHHCEQKGVQIVDIYARQKNIYGIYAKMRLDQKGMNQIRDFFGIRIIVERTEDCYKVLNILHHLWPHYTEHVKDYIRQPKPNGYQSLHTTVSCLKKQDVEFQIRTVTMHEVAQYGVASHAVYKAESR